MKQKFHFNWLSFLTLTLLFALPVWADEDLVNLDDQSGSLPLEQLRIFSQVFGRIKKDYVEKVDDKKLLTDAIKGMLKGLDPHSSYLDADDFKHLKEGTSGEFGGLGIEVGSEDGYIKVISPIDDTPAYRAGIKSGDVITRIDDKPIKGNTLGESIKLMRGKPGTSTTLTIIREGLDKPLSIKIIRDVIQTISVRHKILEDQIGYVRISQFQSTSPEDLLKAISKLKKKMKGNIAGLVLDLRNNPGGVLNAAVSISDAFLEDGLIVYTKGIANDSKMDFMAAPDDVLNGAPLVVLVNEGSASASEIVAGALQDHHRAIIVGRRTFGKGSVQTIVPITEKIAVKITTARYYTPLGRSIQAEGIQPDIVLENVEVKNVKKAVVKRVKESDLKGHLENEKQLDDDSNNKDKEKSLAERDYELSAALNLLKGLVLLNPVNKK